MTRYLTLMHFTEQGAKNISQSTARAHAFNEAAAKLGVKVEAQYWTVGAYDAALVLSGEDEKAILRLLTDLVAKGNVRTESLRAFVASEFTAVVGP